MRWTLSNRADQRARPLADRRETVTIFGPMRLAVSDSGGHRIVDAANHGYYIPPTWIHIEWIVKAGADPVVA